MASFSLTGPSSSTFFRSQREASFYSSSNLASLGPRASKEKVTAVRCSGESREGVIQERKREREGERVNEGVLGGFGGVVTDVTVPEGHRGLHGFLYGEAGADVHDAEDATYVSREGEDDGSAIVPFEEYVTKREGEKFAGVYAVYAQEDSLQYVGYSRNVVLSLKAHLATRGSDKCHAVKVRMYTEASLVSRARLEDERQKWINEAQTLPPGNGAEINLWEGPNGPGTSAMSERERGAYEEKKLKMRKAMGENLYDEVEGETEDSRTRRLSLLQATEGDNWSSVIDGQTKATLVDPRITSDSKNNVLESSPEILGSQENGQIVSPFARPNAPSLDNSAEKVDSVLELSVVNVDKALDEVRPYLIADGGNVEVVGVENGVVLLRLQGACGTCPSSTATMKMGIERSLRNTFGELLKEVMQVDKLEMGATMEGVESLLETLRPAIRNFKGQVEVVSVDRMRASCEVKYKGPPPVGMGIQAAIKDKFPDIRTVKLLSF